MRAVVDSNVIISAVDSTNPNNSLAIAILRGFSSWVVPSRVFYGVERWANGKGLGTKIEVLKHNPRVEILDISYEEVSSANIKLGGNPCVGDIHCVYAAAREGLPLITFDIHLQKAFELGYKTDFYLPKEGTSEHLALTTSLRLTKQLGIEMGKLAAQFQANKKDFLRCTFLTIIVGFGRWAIAPGAPPIELAIPIFYFAGKELIEESRQR